MERTLEKTIHLSEEPARRLEQLATHRGMTEDALITEALELLFRQSGLSDADAEVDDLEYLRRLEAEIGPLPPLRTVPSIRPEDIVSIIPVYVRPELIRRLGETP